MWKRLVFLLLVGVWLAPWPDLIPKGKRFPVGVWPAWERVKNRKDAADFATYYYATQVAFAGGDPYRTKSLSRAARKDLTRKSVHPYFYPPPFVLGMAWTQPLDLKTAYHAWFWFNQLCLLATLWIFWKWLDLLNWVSLPVFVMLRCLGGFATIQAHFLASEHAQRL